ncbi:hypothetical protein DFH09DRAFT_449335 [Mycena vulgaris]|nr:hypothetical protein DFH09DRAFT_449335 [Mycena vulgaris]
MSGTTQYMIEGLFLRNNFMRVFRSNGGPLREVSRPSLDTYWGGNGDPAEIEITSQKALARDGFRCLISGFYDYPSCNAAPELKPPEADKREVETQCAHIFSESAQSNPEYAAGAMAPLELFGIPEVVQKLLEANVNELFNVLSMSIQLHTQFDRLHFWLEQIPNKPHHYKVCASNDRFFEVLTDTPRREVVFAVDPDVVARCTAKNIAVPELPDPDLLALRAACSRVAHMSGAAEQYDQILRDLDEISVMSSDGSSAGFLETLLLAHALG